MAMWSNDAFSNDDALDFIGVLGMLSDSKKVSILRDALETGASNTVLDMADTCGAVVAAALVAIQLSPQLMPEDPTIEEVISKLPDVSNLQPLAHSALTHCMQDEASEWFGLLAEQRAVPKMMSNLQPYLEALST